LLIPDHIYKLEVIMSKIVQIKGKAVPIEGDDIDTDQIMPARFLKEITFDKMGDYLFCDLRFDANGKSLDFILDRPAYQNSVFLFVGKNFGCGSSREHAPQAIKRYGIKAIVGLSFAEIFAGNCKSLGIPLVTVESDILESLYTILKSNSQSEFVLDLEKKIITCASQQFPIDIPEARRQSFLDGTWDSLQLLKEQMALVEKVASHLPYLNHFN